MINLSIPQPEAQLRPRITVIGVGGAGGNAVNNMIRANLEGVEFVATNTDAQALASSCADKRLQLGTGITQGLGAGSRPDVGRAAAEEVFEEISTHLEGAHMVFITAGMGGGTGTGAAPVIARAARDQGILTVGVVTKPFHFEGAHRMKIAENGIHELQQYVDTLIVIPNQNLFRIANEKTTFADAFKMADDVLHSGVRGVTDLMVMPGLINLDFADIRTVMAEMGKAMMGTGEAEGDRRSVLAAEAAISNPLLDDVSMKGARGVLINITGGMDMTLYEVDEAANRIRDEVDPDANIIFGSTFDESLQGRVRVSVVATGIDLEMNELPRPSTNGLTLVSSHGQSGSSRHAAGDPVRSAMPGPATAAARSEPAVAEPPMMPMMPKMAPSAERAAHAPALSMPMQPAARTVTQPAAPPAVQAGEMPAPAPAAQAAVATQLAGREERHEAAGVAARPGHAVYRQPAAMPGHPAQPLAEGDLANAGRTVADHVKKRSSNIFRRVTGLLQAEEAGHEVQPSFERPAARPAAPTRPLPSMRPAAEPTGEAREEPRPQAQPAPRQPAAQARLDINQRPPLPRHEDDALDIPAFLRRQAN